MAAELAVGYITLVPSAKGIVGGIEKELGAPAAAAGLTGGTRASAGFATSFKKGIKAVAVPAAVIGGIVGIGLKFNDAFNTIARGTGATGARLDSLDQSFRNVLKSGSGSFSQVSQAVTVLYQRTGLTGKALDGFAAKQVTLARITKTDVGANLQATTGLFNLYGVAATQQSDKLDVLFRASQQGGVSITQLASDMQAAAPTAKALGLSIDQTAALTSGLEKAGLPAGKVMLGLASSFAKAAKAGKDPLSVIHDLVDEVKKAPSATAAATIATTKFGIGARQATTLVAGLRSGAINLNTTLAGGKGINDTAAATQTLSGKFAHLKNVALVGLEPLATKTLGAVTRGVGDLIPVVGFLTDHMDILGPVLLTVAGGFVALKAVLGVQSVIAGVGRDLTKLKGLLVSTATANDTLATSSGAAVVAEEAEAVAAGETAVAHGVAAEAALADAEATDVATASAAAFSLTPLGAGLAVAAVAIGVLTAKTHLFSHGQKDAGDATNNLIGSLLKEGKTLGDVSQQVVIKAIGDNKDFATAINALHVPLTVVSGALAGNAGQQKKLGDAIRGGLKSGKLSLDQFIAIRNELDKNKKSLDDQSGSYNRTQEASKEFASQTSTTNTQLQIQHDKWTNLTTAILNNTDALRGSQEGVLGILAASVAAEQGVAQTAQAQKDYNDAVAKFGPSSAEAHAALLTLQSDQISQKQSVLSAVDATETWAAKQSGLTDALKNQADTLKKSGPDSVAYARATDAVSAAQGRFKQDLQAAAATTKGPVHDAIVGYINDTANLHATIDKVPSAKSVTYTTPGLGAATTRTHDFRGELDGLKSKSVTITLFADQALHSLSLLDQAVRKINPNVSLVAVNRAEGGRGSTQPPTGHAGGGFIDPGTWGLTGERGPELVFGGKTGVSVTPNRQSMWALTADDFARSHDGPRAVFTGPIQSWDDRDLARRLNDRMRREETLAGVR